MKYPYQHAVKKRHVLIGLYAAAIIISLTVLNTVSGYITYTDTTRAENEDLRTEVASVQSINDLCYRNLEQSSDAYGDCAQKLRGSTSELLDCAVEADKVQKRLETVNASYSACAAETAALAQAGNALAADMTALQANYESLAAKAAAAICCRPGVPSSSWDVTNNTVVCSGPRQVSCP